MHSACDSTKLVCLSGRPRCMTHFEGQLVEQGPEVRSSSVHRVLHSADQSRCLHYTPAISFLRRSEACIGVLPIADDNLFLHLKECLAMLPLESQRPFLHLISRLPLVEAKTCTRVLHTMDHSPLLCLKHSIVLPCSVQKRKRGTSLTYTFLCSPWQGKTGGGVQRNIVCDDSAPCCA